MAHEDEISKFFLNNTQNRNDDSILTNNYHLNELDRFYSDENGDRILCEDFVNTNSENSAIVNVENDSHNTNLFLNNTQSELDDSILTSDYFNELERFYCDNSDDNIVNEAYSNFIDENSENISKQNDQNDVSYKLFLKRFLEIKVRNVYVHSLSKLWTQLRYFKSVLVLYGGK